WLSGVLRSVNEGSPIRAILPCCVSCRAIAPAAVAGFPWPRDRDRRGGPAANRSRSPRDAPTRTSGPFYIDGQSFVDNFERITQGRGSEIRDTLIALGYARRPSRVR